MTDELRHLHRPFSDNEKAAIREELRVFMRAHPAQAPFYLRALDSLQSTALNPRFQAGLAAAGLILVTGTGTAFAAQGALPGDALYGIKVNIEEPIVGSFATSPQAKANWSAQLAGRRLAEAEQLAVKNKLTPAAASTIAGGLDQATQNFDASVSALATSSDNAATVATLASTMEATLAANTQVMNEIASAVPAAAPTLKPLLSSVQERATSLNSARTAMDLAAAETGDQQIRVAAQSQYGTAQDQVNSAIASANAAPDSTSSSAEIQVAVAKAQLDSGHQALDQGDYASALENFQAASVNAHVAQLKAAIGAQLGAGAQDSSTTIAVAASTTTNASTSSTTMRTASPMRRVRSGE